MNEESQYQSFFESCIYIDVDVNFMVAAVQIEHINTVTDSFPCLIAVVSID